MSGRIIFQNVDDIPDEVMATVMVKGLPERGTARYQTVLGEIVVTVVRQRESRVYKVIRTENPKLLINAFADLV